jgi:hypothetical protein
MFISYSQHVISPFYSTELKYIRYNKIPVLWRRPWSKLGCRAKERRKKKHIFIKMKISSRNFWALFIK